YGYAYASTRWLGVRGQALLHCLLLFAPLLVLPIAVPAGWQPPSGVNPTPWLLALFWVAVGLPFFVVSTSGPTLQRWFSQSGHPTARDPYFLYAASNVGSLLALVAYPLLLEPSLRLVDQSLVWTAGYAALIVAVAGCAVLLWRANTSSRPVFAAAPQFAVALAPQLAGGPRGGRAPGGPGGGAPERGAPARGRRAGRGWGWGDGAARTAAPPRPQAAEERPRAAASPGGGDARLTWRR